jgi:hypothetical protein
MDRKELIHKINGLNAIFSEGPKEPFFRNYVLPTEREVDEYRKVQSLVRIYVNGEGVLKGFTKLTKAQMTARLSPLFPGASKWSGNLRRGEAFASWKMKRRLEKMVDRMVSHQEDFRKYAHRPKKLISEMKDFLLHAKPRLYGAKVLDRLVGRGHIFVMGEIFGIYPSFNQLQTFEPIMARRFAGKSWGTYVVTPPMRKFLAENDLMPISSFVSIGIDQNSIMAPPPTTRPWWY